MDKQSTTPPVTSSVSYADLEGWARGKIQSLLQQILEEEVTELLGRQKSARKDGIDAPAGYRNGYGKERRFALTSGTVTLKRPRVRGLERRFESRILPLFARRTKEVGDLIPDLYLHGLALGDFDLALRGLLGEGAPLSPSAVARLKEKWKAEFDEWKRRSLRDMELVYLWVDGIYVKAGLEKEKAALLVAVGAQSDGSKVVVGLAPGYRESEESWAELLRDMRDRGLRAPKVAIGDGHLGFWKALPQVYPGVMEQRCWNHRLVNILDKLPQKQQALAKPLLQEIPYSPTREKAETAKESFQAWCRKNGFDSAARALDQDWERMITFYQLPKEHWKHLRTTNVIESPFATVRLRTGAAKRFKKVANATAVIWKVLMLAERTFRKLDAPELCKEVFLGAVYENGVRATPGAKENGA